MTKRIRPHHALMYARPDEVAECWDEVDDELYLALWACVPHYKGPSPEEAEEPMIGHNAVSRFWSRFTDSEKVALNAIARNLDRRTA